MEGRAKKKRRLPLPLIVLLAVLVAGGILAGLLLSGVFASEEEKAEKALEQTKEQCTELLSKERYEELSELYDSVSEYSECQDEIRERLKNHVVDTITGQNAQRFAKVYRVFPETDALFEPVHTGMHEGVEKLCVDGCENFMIFHQKLAEIDFFLEELDDYVIDYIRDMLEVNDYTFAATYFHILDHCQTCVIRRQQLYEEKMAAFLASGDLESADLVYGQMRYLEMDEQRAGRIFLDYANGFMEQENYAAAKYLLQILRDGKHPLYNLDVQYTYRLAVLHVYIEEGRLADAEKWANSFAGETRDKLMEVLLNYTGGAG